MATALVAAKLGVRIAHVEAGLRSGDRAMPEEINRIVADRVADLLLTPSRDADETLRREGARPEQIVFVGNVMIDSLLHALPRAEATGAARRLGADGSHVLVTLHRPSNVDDDARLRAILDALARDRPDSAACSSRRIRGRRSASRRSGCPLDGVELLAPLPYHDMVDVMTRAHAVVTDSGGIQEETTALGVPCFTVRDNTERPITITEGTNQLVRDPATLPAARRGRASSRTSAAPRRLGWVRRRANHRGIAPAVSSDGAMEYPRGATRWLTRDGAAEVR